MDEGILEVSELAGDRIVELRVVDELRVVGLITCKMGEIVKGDEGPVSGVAQVVCHGVKVVGVHGEEGREEEGEVQGEAEREVDNRTCAWREDGMTDSRNLSQVECDVSMRMTRQTSNSVQACSDLANVVLVLVRRVTVVIVHIGHQDVVLVVK